MSAFDGYADYYELFYKEKDYASEAGYALSHLRCHGSRGTNLLELGCGTGSHAEHFARLGHAVHGVDLSPNMLKAAESKKTVMSQELRARLNFTQGDIRTIRLEKRFDAVVSLFHVFSYQTTNDDLSAAVATAAAHLADGGILLFDFWYGPAVIRQLPEVRVQRFEDKDVRLTRIAEPVVHVDKNIVDVNYELLIERKPDGKLETIRETHSMRYLFIPEIELLLARHGMELIGSHAWMKTTAPGFDSWNACAVARRS
ncbi:class I SAM-dependent DNA methyltransferase [Methylosarcina fibrata]|uniref:class I SAM-dependent DNA methyltransferase n=1 Tax=Methylosarcina fibrata TaxID=105972 RepID=UPI00035F531B|nr:class I SAM-dependent methyltransferase [Methylosarcina fibrata]